MNLCKVLAKSDTQWKASQTELLKETKHLWEMKLINCFQREHKVGDWEGWEILYKFPKHEGFESKRREFQALNFKNTFQHHGLGVWDRHSELGLGYIQKKALKEKNNKLNA